MPRTERLYYNDSHLIEFEASVVDTSDRVSGWSAVTLDRTAFYPTGGGQPSDTGTLNGTRVVECIDDGDNGVLHVMQGRPPEIGSTVRGRIDWSRRRDHMQQHTGQHILSQAFITLFSAPTKGFRMLEQSCEIDVELANPADDLIERAVQLANNVIWEDRRITIKTVSAEAAAQLPLRKDSARTGELRLIEIDGFDLTPCGGTHAYRTGEVGMIAVRSWERAKGLTRIVFVAGTRALADYQAANKTAQAVASLYSAARDDAAKLTKRVLDENKELHRRVRVLEEIAARVEAEELVQQAGIVGILDASVRDSEGVTDSSRGSSAQRDTPGIAGYSVPDPKGVADVHGAGRQVDPARLRLVTKVFDNRDAESLKHLAQALISHPMTIALLGSREKDAARLVFARSADAPGDMNALMKAACVLLDGRGGGKPDLAQGGGHNVEKLQAAIDNACECFSQRMSEQEIRLRGPDPKRANDPIKATK